MALTDENGMNTTMLVSPTGGMSNGFGNGFGGDGWWIILLLLFACGGWGNGFGGNGGGVRPFMMGTNDVQRGFDQASIMSGIGDINAGINGIQTSLCNGFAGVNQAVSNGFAQAEIANNARQMADMQSMYGIQSALQSCCCENRASIADLKYTVATENCADRTQSLMNTRDIIENQTRNTQAILDKMCQQEIQAKDDLIGQLRQEVLFARGQASQIAQNEQIVNSIYNRLDQCPVGTTPVYGRTPIFTCNSGCGCGM